MDISLGKLHHMAAVARCGSFSAAAKELHISQPALSRSIAAVEQCYGFRIFNRVGHGVELTAAGSQVIDQARPLIQSLLVFDSNLHLFGAGKAGNLAVGFAPLLASELLARFAAGFLAPGSNARLKAIIRPGFELLDALRNDEIEICFFPESQVRDSPDIEIKALASVMPTCVVRSTHPLANRGRMKLADLADFPWASSVEPPFGPDVPSRSRFICDNYHVLREAVLATDLVCICSTEFVAPQLADGTLVAIEIDGLPLRPTTVFVAKLTGRVSSPLAEAAMCQMAGYLLRSSQ